MAPAGLGRRGRSQGATSRPSGRTSGRPWPPLSGGPRRHDEASCRAAGGRLGRGEFRVDCPPGWRAFTSRRRHRAAVRSAGLSPLVSTRQSGSGDPPKSPRRKPGNAGLHAVAGAMRWRFMRWRFVRWRFVRWNHVRSCGMDGGLVVMPGVPGFPPGASWNGDGTDALFNPSTHHGSQAYSWSGGLLSLSLHPQKA